MAEDNNTQGATGQNASDYGAAYGSAPDAVRGKILKRDNARTVTSQAPASLAEAAKAQQDIQIKYAQQLQEIANLVVAGNIRKAEEKISALITLERDESIGKMTDQRSLEMGQAQIGQLFKKFGQILQGIGEAWGNESVAEFGAKLSSVPDGRAFLEYNAVQADLTGLNALNTTLSGSFSGPATAALPGAIDAAKTAIGRSQTAYNQAGRAATNVDVYPAPAP